ncbi:FtsH protease activity modulator HflK [Salinispira pacifica]|uniref:Protein HflK n=1 Tax=Salinispira pacifica TaxID=1307761 RepID=V5WIJ7_9SPIO|nr:FtsH protease activity modulator HflK [Salinispira pacifica]AHC14986.1 HflK protein [Salinispira pacifica]
MSDENRPKKKAGGTITTSMIILILVGLVVLGGALSTFFQVDATEQAVITRLGRYNRTKGAGLHFKIPFGIEQHFIVPTELNQSMSFGYRALEPGVQTVYDTRDYPEESVMLTGDINIIDVEWVIQFLITDPQNWLFNVDDPYKTISDISKSVINRLVGDESLNAVLGPARPAIEDQARQDMNVIFDDYELGINVTTVELKNVLPPSGRVEEAFKDVQDAQQDMERLINEGQQAYNTEIPRARGEKERAIQTAQGYANERVNQAEGDVARFIAVLGEYSNDPDTTRTRLYYEMVEEVFQDAETTNLIDRDLQNFLPLLNLNQQQGQTQGGTQ